MKMGGLKMQYPTSVSSSKNIPKELHNSFYSLFFDSESLSQWLHRTGEKVFRVESGCSLRSGIW
jgi:hypothetical protein